MTEHTTLHLTVRTTPRTQPVTMEWATFIDEHQFTPRQMTYLDAAFKSLTRGLATLPGRIELSIEQTKVIR